MGRSTAHLSTHLLILSATAARMVVASGLKTPKVSAWGIAASPFETDSVAVIDTDTVLPFPVGLQRFQMKARQPEIAQ